MIGAAHHLNRSIQTIIGRAHYYLLDRYHILTVRGLLIAVCLALTVLTAVLLQERRIAAVGVVAGFAGLAFAVFAYRHMELMCLAVLVVSTVFDLGVGTGTGTDIKLVLVLLVLLIGLWAFRLFVVERSVAGVRGKWVIAPALLFALAVVISLGWSTVYVDPALVPVFRDKSAPRLMTAIVLIISPLTTLLYANFMRSVWAFKFAIWWFIIVGGVTVVLRILSVQVLPVINTGGQFAAWVSILAAGQFIFNKEIPLRWRSLLILVPVGWLYVTFGLGITWLAGWVPIIGGLSTLIVLRSLKLVSVLLLVFTVVMIANSAFFNEVVEAERNESAITRLEALNRALDISAQHFLFGTGPAGYHFYFSVYLGEVGLTHNNYVDIVAQTGAVGLALFLWFWGATGWMVWTAYRIVPRGGFRHALAASSLAAYPVTLVMAYLGDWVTPFTYTQTLSGISYTIWHWILPGVAIALYYDARRQRSA